MAALSRVRPIPPSASVHLDAVRGAAALVVVVGHVGDLFLPRWSSLDGASRTIVARAMYTSVGFAHQAVIVFFVLSGLLVGGEVMRLDRSWSWRRYAVARLSRLYVVLLPALAVTALADHIGRSLAGGGHLYQHAESTWPAFAGNLLFLQTVAVQTFGSNGSLWSLSNEFWYYALFPLGVIAWTRRSTPLGIAHLAVLVVLAFLLPRGFAGGFVIWMFGAATRRTWPLEGDTNPRSTGLIAAAMVAVVACIATGMLDGRLSDLVLGVATAWWLHALLRIEGGAVPGRFYSRVSRWAAGCSYSLYVLHYPVLLLVFAASGARTWQPGVSSSLGIVGLVALSLGVAAAFAAVTEHQTHRVRRAVTRLLDGARPREFAPDVVT